MVIHEQDISKEAYGTKNRLNKYYMLTFLTSC